MVCDFCTRAVPTGKGWVLPATSFQLQYPPWGSAGDWLACSFCAHFIRTDNWEGLLDHVVLRSLTTKRTAGNAVATTGLRASLVYCYEELRKNITGPLRPEGF